MGWFSKDVETMQDLFLHGLQDIYYAEKKILSGLTDMADKATNPELRQAFEDHRLESENQCRRLETVFSQLGQEPSSVNCPAIDGIIEEADEISSEINDERVLDAALIASAQAVEHYEISRYGTLVAWAQQLGHTDSADLLQQNLDEEFAADRILTQLAESSVNQQAA
jgi:ferritin-like metal-binding protein YciE